LAGQSYWLHSTGKQPRGRQWSRWLDYITEHALSGFGVEPAELSEIAKNLRYFEST